MGSILEYVQWRGDIPFSVIPPGEADELIFSHLAYLNFQNIVTNHKICLSDAYQAWEEKGYKCPQGIHSVFLWDEIVPMFRLLSETPRYRDCLFSDFECVSDEQTESQFAAITLTVPGLCVKHLLFRGTDDSLIGWKENLNMSYLTAIPAQLAALEYLKKQVGDDDAVILNGHSKGGNLAVYAASTAPSEIQSKIQCIWNFDGPGFRPEFFRSDGYRSVFPKIRMYVPESSVFGMMLSNDGHFRVVKSQRKGVAQHDGFSWEISGCGFQYADALSPKSKLINRIMNLWLSNIADEERKKLIGCVFRMLVSEKFQSMTEVNAKENRHRILHAYLNTDPASRKVILHNLLPLVRLWKSAQIVQTKREKQTGKLHVTSQHTKPAAT